MKTKFNSTTMKTMKNFAAQQLSKKQMNEVKGGIKIISDEMVICRFYDGDRYVGSNFIPAGEDQMPLYNEAKANGFTTKCDTNF